MIRPVDNETDEICLVVNVRRWHSRRSVTAKVPLSKISTVSRIHSGVFPVMEVL